MAADLVAIDTSGVAFEGLAQGKDPEGPLLAGLMLGAHPGQVSDVWVGGRQVVSDGELLRWESARDSYLKVAAKLWS
jgi:cytosine/adenosine deaminase-related metal-dependent hydrolase